MGLDMYLKRIPKMESNEKVDELLNRSEFETTEKMIEHGKKLSENFDPKRHVYNSDYFDVGWIGEEVGYWRKSNHIHRWFVENVQNNVDDCGNYLVTKEQLKELLNVAKSVIPLARTPGAKKNAEAKLPFAEGFFFGETKYDEYYFNDCKDTVKILKEILKETDFEKESIVYHSSW